MAVEDSSEIVKVILNEFGLANAEIEFLKSSVHSNVKVRTTSGNYFLKILDDEYTATGVRSQLQFMEYLREGGLPVAKTIATENGQGFARVSVGDTEMLGILSEWIDGERLGDLTNNNWIERCGTLLARLHLRSQSFAPPQGFALRSWDEVYIPDEQSWLSRFLEKAPVDDAAVNVFEQAAVRVRGIQGRMPISKAVYGLIHADFHIYNILFNCKRDWIIDFEDVGWGHYLLDITWPAALAGKHRPEESGYLEQFLRGYEHERALSELEKKLLPEFLLAAGLAVVEMIDSSPAANDSPLAQEWFKYAVEWIRRHFETIDD